MNKNNQPPATTEEKLDRIVEYLHRMDKRDRLRAWGGFFRGILGLIPLIVFLFGLWYLYHHGDELMARIAKQAAEQAARVTQEGAGNIMLQFENMMNKQ